MHLYQHQTITTMREALTMTRLVLALAVGVCVLRVSSVTGAQNAAELPFTLKQVGPNVWAAISNSKSPAAASANTGFVIGDDAVAVIDTTLNVDANGNFGTVPAQQLVAAIRRLTKLPVRFVINTHYHFDHTGANAVFVKAGAIAVAHHNVRGWNTTDNLRILGKEIKTQQKTFIEAIPPPTVTFDHEIDLHLGARAIQLRSFPGHTGGDSVVLVPDAKVVFAGDLFWHDMLPNMIDASTQGWIDTLATLTKSEPAATFVPGHGDLGTVQDVDAFRGYLVTLRKLVSDAQARGQSGEALANAVIAALTDKYNRWDGFKYLARVNVIETDAELSGKKRIPQPAR
jgi:glyoxylase-like metal-dependent hydrolase (beta-lactamase superfamily II)